MTVIATALSAFASVCRTGARIGRSSAKTSFARDLAARAADPSCALIERRPAGRRFSFALFSLCFPAHIGRMASRLGPVHPQSPSSEPEGLGEAPQAPLEGVPVADA